MFAGNLISLRLSRKESGMSSLLRRALVCASLLALTTASAAQAATPTGRRGLRGVRLVPHVARTSRPPVGMAARKQSESDLTYHHGPVMVTNTTYAIYWTPPGFSVGSGYEATIDQYLSDVAAASGATDNVYHVLTQYYEAPPKTFITDTSTFGGSVVDTHAFPKKGCDRYKGLSRCLSNKQVRVETHRVAMHQGWSIGPNTSFFMMLPKRVGTCYGQLCAYSYFCAYHSYAGSSGSGMLYANVPYGHQAKDVCASASHPNGNDADDSLDSISHEHREMINDPYLNAWYDSRGQEGSDKCAWRYSPILGTTIGGQAYNQVINGHDYFLQKEWSNATHQCEES
jgi:hypothetical protein